MVSLVAAKIIFCPQYLLGIMDGIHISTCRTDTGERDATIFKRFSI